MKCCRPTGLQRCYYDPAAPLRVATFDSHRIIANPGGMPLGTGLLIIHDGSYFGPSFLTFGCGNTGAIFDLIYTIPRDRVMQVRIHNNGGNVLNDGDGISPPNVQLFDINDNPLTPVFVANAANGAGPDVTAIPGAPINGVAYMRVTNVGCLSVFASPNGLLREIETTQQGLEPAALAWCPDGAGITWLNPKTGTAVSTADLTDCR